MKEATINAGDILDKALQDYTRANETNGLLADSPLRYRPTSVFRRSKREAPVKKTEPKPAVERKTRASQGRNRKFLLFNVTFSACFGLFFWCTSEQKPKPHSSVQSHVSESTLMFRPIGAGALVGTHCVGKDRFGEVCTYCWKYSARQKICQDCETSGWDRQVCNSHYFQSITIPSTPTSPPKPSPSTFAEWKQNSTKGITLVSYNDPDPAKIMYTEQNFDGTRFPHTRFVGFFSSENPCKERECSLDAITFWVELASSIKSRFPTEVQPIIFDCYPGRLCNSYRRSTGFNSLVCPPRQRCSWELGEKMMILSQENATKATEWIGNLGKITLLQSLSVAGEFWKRQTYSVRITLFWNEKTFVDDTLVKVWSTLLADMHRLMDFVNVNAVNCGSNDATEAMCAQEGISQFPTVRVYINGDSSPETTVPHNVPLPEPSSLDTVFFTNATKNIVDDLNKKIMDESVVDFLDASTLESYLAEHKYVLLKSGRVGKVLANTDAPLRSFAKNFQEENQTIHIATINCATMGNVLPNVLPCTKANYLSWYKNGRFEARLNGLPGALSEHETAQQTMTTFVTAMMATSEDTMNLTLAGLPAGQGTVPTVLTDLNFDGFWLTTRMHSFCSAQV